MPEPMQQQTNTAAKADEGELGTVIFWSGRFGFARLDRGGSTDIYLGAPQLFRANIPRLEIGQRLCFEVRKGTDGRRPWAARIRVLDHA
jgi:cold shock CspA family protein